MRQEGKVTFEYACLCLHEELLHSQMDFLKANNGANFTLELPFTFRNLQQQKWSIFGSLLCCLVVVVILLGSFFFFSCINTYTFYTFE